MTIAAMKEKRAKAIVDAKAVMTLSETESRDLTADEARSFDGFMADAENLKVQITRLEALAAIETEQTTSRGRIIPADGIRSGYDANEALRGWLLAGSDKAPTASQLSAAHAAGLTGRSFTFSLRPDALRSQDDPREWANRAQATAPLSAGGYLVAPEFHRELEVALLSFGGMREVASIVRTSTGAPMPWPVNNDTSNEGEIIGENIEVTEQDMVFSSRTLGAFKYSSKLIRVSVELIQDSAVNIAEVVGKALGERIGRIQNRHFTSGIGTTQPFGIVTEAVLGATAASSTEVTYDELVDLQFSVGSDYRKNGTWMFNDATLAKLMKLRDDDGSLIWQQGLAGGTPNTILSRPYVINNDVPPIGAGAKAILYGDMSKYKIRDVSDIFVQRLDERFAEFGQVGFLAFARADGLLLDAGTHPVKYLKMA